VAKTHVETALSSLISFVSPSIRQPLKDQPGHNGLNKEKSLRVLFWNIYRVGSDLEHRASSAIEELKEAFMGWPSPMVVVLHGVHRQAFEAIREHSWIKENFALSNAIPPQNSFTLIMVSRQLHTGDWFRVGALSQMERDALLVEIPVSSLRDTNTLGGHRRVRSGPWPRKGLAKGRKQSNKI
jgi:hypothetical protein